MDKNKLILITIIGSILAISLILFAINNNKKDNKENSYQPQSKADAYRSVFGK